MRQWRPGPISLLLLALTLSAVQLPRASWVTADTPQQVPRQQLRLPLHESRDPWPAILDTRLSARPSAVYKYWDIPLEQDLRIQTPCLSARFCECTLLTGWNRSFWLNPALAIYRGQTFTVILQRTMTMNATIHYQQTDSIRQRQVLEANSLLFCKVWDLVSSKPRVDDCQVIEPGPGYRERHPSSWHHYFNLLGLIDPRLISAGPAGGLFLQVGCRPKVLSDEYNVTKFKETVCLIKLLNDSMTYDFSSSPTAATSSGSGEGDQARLEWRQSHRYLASARVDWHQRDPASMLEASVAAAAAARSGSVHSNPWLQRALWELWVRWWGRWRWPGQRPVAPPTAAMPPVVNTAWSLGQASGWQEQQAAAERTASHQPARGALRQPLVQHQAWQVDGGGGGSPLVQESEGGAHPHEPPLPKMTITSHDWPQGQLKPMRYLHWKPPVEKNWVPFNYKGTLLWSRHLNPHQVVTLHANGTATLLYMTKHTAAFAGLASICERGPRGNTPALRLSRSKTGFGRDVYLGIMHWTPKPGSFAKDTLLRTCQEYLNFFYLMEAEPPFKIIEVARPPIPLIAATNPAYDLRPLHWGMGYISFPTGMIIMGNQVVIMYGSGDHVTRVWRAALEDILLTFTVNMTSSEPVNSAANARLGATPAS